MAFETKAKAENHNMLLRSVRIFSIDTALIVPFLVPFDKLFYHTYNLITPKELGELRDYLIPLPHMRPN